MNILKISLDENADIPFLKKLLMQLKGISHVEVSKQNDEVLSDQEENDLLNALLEKSQEQSKKGLVKEITPEILEKMFTK